jgi:hypothetical protein
MFTTYVHLLNCMSTSLQPIRLFIGSCMHLHSDCGSHIMRRLLLLLLRV